MKFSRANLRTAMLLLGALALGGCVRIDIGGTHEPTIGRQLMDLQAAKASGAIDGKAFERLQHRLLAGAAACSMGAAPSC